MTKTLKSEFDETFVKFLSLYLYMYKAASVIEEDAETGRDDEWALEKRIKSLRAFNHWVHNRPDMENVADIEI